MNADKVADVLEAFWHAAHNDHAPWVETILLDHNLTMGDLYLARQFLETMKDQE